MWMKEMFMLYLSLSLGYLVCVIARKQKGLLRTVGNTLGISIIVLSLLIGVVSAGTKCSMKGKGMICGKQVSMGYHHPTMKMK